MVQSRGRPRFTRSMDESSPGASRLSGRISCKWRPVPCLTSVKTRTAAALLFGLGLVGCTPPPSLPATDEREAERRQEMAELRADVARLRADVDALDERASALEASVAKPKASDAARRADLDPPQELLEAVDLSRFLPKISCEADECSVPSDLMKAFAGRPEAVLKSVRVVPAVEGGRSMGMKLYGIRRGSLFKALGFKNGDRVTSLGGLSIEGIESVLEALDAYEAGAPFDVQFIRDAETKTMRITIVD